MLVKNWMSQNVVSIDAGVSMLDAVNTIKKFNIRMLPVMEKSKLVGIITDRDLKRASASDATTLEVHELLYLLAKIRVKSIMTSSPITIRPDQTVDEAAEVMWSHKISGLPVVNNEGALIGIITKTDIFRFMVSLTGLAHRGIQFGFLLPDQPGAIKGVTDIIRSFGGRLASILSRYDRAPEGYRRVYIRVYDLDRNEIEALKKKLHNQAKVLFIIDLVNGQREIYEE